MRAFVTTASALVLASLSAGCAQHGTRDLERASRELGRAVGRGDGAAVRAAAAPGMRSRVDLDALVSSEEERAAWRNALSDPLAVEPTALVLLHDEFPVTVVETASGWRFAEDPTAVYAQDTPRHALRALVWATRAQRWDVVLRLAPMRYRMGLSEEDLRIAWTEGEYAEALTTARDVVAKHLGDPIEADSDEAVLRIGVDHDVRLERERDQWVIVDFIGGVPADSAADR